MTLTLARHAGGDGGDGESDQSTILDKMVERMIDKVDGGGVEGVTRLVTEFPQVGEADRGLKKRETTATRG